MPGGGHKLASNFLYSIAPKDGTTIATVNQSVPAHQVLDGRGVRYDADKFNWLGALGDRNQVFVVQHQTVRLQFPLRETAYRVTRVAEQYAAGTVAIQQVVNSGINCITETLGFCLGLQFFNCVGRQIVSQ